MNVEFETLNKNKTWKLVHYQLEKKIVGCKWVYTIKYRGDETTKHYKKRLLTKGFTETYGVDYLEIFVPVAKMNTVKIILLVATNHN